MKLALTVAEPPNRSRTEQHTLSLDTNSLDGVLSDAIAPAVIELGGSRAGMVRHFLGEF